LRVNLLEKLSLEKREHLKKRKKRKKENPWFRNSRISILVVLVLLL
jgi:hypothetical protein